MPCRARKGVELQARNPMIRSAYAGLIAGGTFIYLLALQLSGPGRATAGTVAALVALDAVIALAVFLRVPDYLAWYRADRGVRRAALEGAGFGLAGGVALLLILSVGGTAGRLPEWTGFPIWLTVSTVFGATSALSIYLLGALWQPAGDDGSEQHRDAPGSAAPAISSDPSPHP